MKNHVASRWIIVFTIIILAVSVCCMPLDALAEGENYIFFSVNDQKVKIRLADTIAARELKEMAVRGDFYVDTSDNKFEQYGSLGKALTTDDLYIDAKPKDVLLYNGKYICLLYGSNSYQYTRLGWIEDVSESELKNILSGTNLKLTFSVASDVIENDTNMARKNNVKAFVERLYTNVLGREADVAGLNDWSKKLVDKERTGSEVALGFFMSQEMIDRNLSDEDYVKICYRTMLNREADAGGLEDWVSKLENGRSREAVLYGFSNSVEFGNICNQYGIERGTLQSRQNRDQNDGITSFVARCYTKALGRKFDIDGLNDWTGQILVADNKKQKAEAVASDGFFHSQEFVNKDITNGEYVEILYRTFLGREYDEVGYKDWVSQLDSGKSRDEVLYGFARSVEFNNIMSSYGL